MTEAEKCDPSLCVAFNEILGKPLEITFNCQEQWFRKFEATFPVGIVEVQVTIRSTIAMYKNPTFDLRNCECQLKINILKKFEACIYCNDYWDTIEKLKQLNDFFELGMDVDKYLKETK